MKAFAKTHSLAKFQGACLLDKTRASTGFLKYVCLQIQITIIYTFLQYEISLHPKPHNNIHDGKMFFS